MTAARHPDAIDVSQLALDAFEATVASQLGRDGGPVDLRNLLSAAFAAACQAIEDATGSVEVDETWRLPGALDRLRDLDAIELTDLGWHELLLPDDAWDLIDLLAASVDQLEWLATCDDRRHGGFTSSGGTDFFAAHHRGRVFWVQTSLDYGDPYVLEYGYRHGDDEGRRRMLAHLIDDYLFAGTIDITLGDAFDDDLRQRLRRNAESNHGAPWDTGFLSKDIEDCNDEELAARAAVIAADLPVEEAAVLASLRRLREDPTATPATELDRVVAWNVSWPALRIRS